MMNLERLREIDATYQHVLELAEHKRPLFLARLARTQPELAGDVARLLEDQEKADGYFDELRSTAAEAVPTTAGPIRSCTNETELSDKKERFIGSYRLLHTLGRGGMGTVYLAERADGAFDKQVAIKIIRWAVPDPVDEARFRRECRLQAGLEHPHIARLMDSGVDEAGSSYLVMELVRGVPIDQFCNEQELDLKARLNLFEQVLEAVQYAHRNLVLHRDLKPSNVLVNHDGQVKLLDFGIAKFLQDDAPSTQTGMQMFSPGYASPEQLLGLELTTASDVYGLGILLFELLTQQRPFPVTRMGLPPVVMGHRFAARPSSLEAAVDSGPGSKRFRSQLKGDLDCLVLKALHPEVARRYATAEAFRQDLSCVMNGRPISVRGDSWVYRTGKFVRRHWAGVATATAVAVLVIGFLIVSWDQSIKIRMERDRYQAVTAQLTKLLHSSDPDQAGSDVRFAEVLSAFSSELELEPDSQTKAKILSIVGESYENLGLYSDANKLVTQALAIQARILGSSHEDTLFSEQVLAIIELRLGKTKQAELRAQELISKRVKANGADHHDTMMARQLLAVLVGEQGRYDEARAMLDPIANALRSEFGERDQGFMGALENLGRYETRAGHEEQGLRHLREAFQLKSDVLGANSPLTLSASVNLGAELMNQNQLVEADKYLSQAVEAHRNVYGLRHPKTLAAEQNLARLFDLMDRNQDALLLVTSCLQAKREILGERHPGSLACQSLYANILRHAGRFEEALEVAKNTERLQSEVVGKLHPYTILAMDQVASFLLDLGRTGEARRQIEKTLLVKRELYGPTDRRVIRSMANLATVLQNEGSIDQAVLIKSEVLDQLLCEYESDPGVLVAMNNLAMGLKEQGEFAQSEQLFKDCLQAHRLGTGPTHFYTICTEINLVDVLRLSGQLDEAESLARIALNHADLYFQPGHARTALALNYLAMVWFDQGRKQEAREALLAALDGLASTSHPFADRIKTNLNRFETQRELALN